MPTLSNAEIRGYAQSAGFKGHDLDVAVAVALAESGGNTNAHNAVPPDNSYGLWQINMLGSLGPSRRKSFGLSKNEQLYDPATNAKAAYSIFKGSGWNAWTTYTRGTYKKHMNGSTETTAPETLPATEESAPSGFGVVTGGLNALSGTLFKSLANMTGVAIALVCFIAAVILFMVQSKTGKTLVKKGVKKVI